MEEFCFFCGEPLNNENVYKKMDYPLQYLVHDWTIFDCKNIKKEKRKFIIELNDFICMNYKCVSMSIFIDFEIRKNAIEDFRNIFYYFP